MFIKDFWIVPECQQGEALEKKKKKVIQLSCFQSVIQSILLQEAQ